MKKYISIMSLAVALLLTAIANAQGPTADKERQRAIRKQHKADVKAASTNNATRKEAKYEATRSRKIERSERKTDRKMEKVEKQESAGNNKKAEKTKEKAIKQSDKMGDKADK